MLGPCDGFLENHSDTSVNFCASVMDTMHQETEWGGGTMYTTLYDLNAGTIYLYFFHDYTHVVKYSLAQELKKGGYSLVIPELFPENKKGIDFVNTCNAVSNEVDLLNDGDLTGDSIRFREVTNTLLRRDKRLVGIFADKIDDLGERWLEKENYHAAILVFTINVTVSPGSRNSYDRLASACMKNKQNAQAMTDYEKSVALNPDNQHGKQQIELLKNLLK